MSVLKGDIAELAFSLAALKQGWTVFSPLSHNTKADLVIRKGSINLAIQIKSMVSQGGGRYKMPVCSTLPSCRANAKNYGKRFKSYTSLDFDILAGYFHDRESFILVPIKRAKERTTWNVNFKTGHNVDENNWEVLEFLK